MLFFGKIKTVYAARYQPETQEKIACGYWAFLIFGFVLVLLGSIAYGVWQFMQPLDKGRSDATLGSPQAPLSRSELQEVLTGWDTRVRLFDERQGGPSLADPS